MKNLQRFLGITTFLLAGAAPAMAKVKLPVVFSSHMVLQRGMPVPVWGTADANETVTVKFRDQEKTAVADEKGKWMLKLDSLTAGGPDVMTVTGSNPVPPPPPLPSPSPGASPLPEPVPESNVITLNDVLVGEVWFGSGQSNMALPVSEFIKDDPALATLQNGGPYPQLRMVLPSGWSESTPENVGKFSALLFAFGVNLQQKLNVPVGIMQGANSGQPSGFFLPLKAYDESTICKEAIAKFAKTYPFDDEQKKYEQALATWQALTPEDQKKTPQPQPPHRPGDVSMRPDGKTPYVGVWYEVYVQPFVPYAIRGVLWDQGESRTAIFGLDQGTLMGVLIEAWRKEWGQGDFPFLCVQKPSGLGCAWDYSIPLTARSDKFSPLPAEVPNDGHERENYIQIMKYPMTTLVTTSDLPSGWHPPVKSSYGLRAMQTALGVAYGDKQEIYGPVYESNMIEGGKMKIRFSHIGPGLAFKGGDKLQGFAIAGPDKKFVWADAVIETSPNGVADTVVVSSSAVPQPAAVRYAWSTVINWANLFSQDGLPALTFRTDDWEVPPVPSF